MITKLILLLTRYINTFRGLSLACWRGIAMSFFESTLIGVFYFLTIYFVHDLKMDVATAGEIISFYGMGAIAGGYLGGVMSDKISPVVVSAISLIIQAICYFLFIKLVSFNFLVINVFILGLSSYGFITSNHLSVLNACHGREAQRVKALNLLAAASNLGGGISGIALGYFLYHGFHQVFVGTAILIFALGICTLFFKNTQTDVNTSKNQVNHAEQDGTRYHYSQVSTVLLSVLLVGAVVAQLGTTYPLYIQKLFPIAGLKAVSFLFALNSFMVVLLSTPLGDLCVRYNKMFMVGVAGALIGCGMLLLNFSTTYLIAGLACVVYTLGEMIFFSMAQYICYHSGRASNRGKGLGLFRSVFACSRMLGPVMGGYVYQHVGGEMVWYICGLIGVFSLVTCVAQAEKLVQLYPERA